MGSTFDKETKPMRGLVRNATSCSYPSDWPERDGGEGISGVFEAGVVSEFLL